MPLLVICLLEFDLYQFLKKPLTYWFTSWMELWVQGPKDSGQNVFPEFSQEESSQSLIWCL